MTTNQQNSQLNCQKIAEVLLSNPLVEDCYLLIRDSELVAYIVYSGTGNPEQLSSDVQSKLPDHLLPTLYVQVSNLPLTNTGCVDELALKNIEIIDENLVNNTEKNYSLYQGLSKLLWSLLPKNTKISRYIYRNYCH